MLLKIKRISSNPTIISSISKRMFHVKKSELYKECFAILGIPDTSDQNTVRKTYIELVKKVHPDSGCPEASTERFHQIDNAFKILQQKFAKNRRNINDDDDDIEEAKIFDIRHTAPQHRQYLSYDGIGTGTPYQREKQYQQIRAMKAQERVLKHRLDKSQADEKTLMKKDGTCYRTHAIKTKYGFERVVEDLIQEAISKGDFNNLSGSGKPLSTAQQQNPYLDFTTHKLNKILLDNGFQPEWISLQREIRDTIKSIKMKLEYHRSYFKEYSTLNDQDLIKWQLIVDNYKDDIDLINSKIDKYNLIVPLLDKQMFRIKLNELANTVLMNDSKLSKDEQQQFQDHHHRHHQHNCKSNSGGGDSTNSDQKSSNFLSFLGSLF